VLGVQPGQSRSLLEAVSQTITLFMPLKSDLFKGDPKLEACALHDSAHITPGMTGEQVGKIQTALGILIPDREVTQLELDQKQYGPSTAAAVLDYKTRRKIINFSYQTKPDNIVGNIWVN
jgi:peptidoglycan hydrolase-like protein with peptidoglycan-binding domain